MRLLVTGAKGMLGQDLVLEMERRAIPCLATDVAELDLLDTPSVQRFADGSMGRFDWVVNCAAYTAVDKAEADKLLAFRLNATAPGVLAHACGLHGARLLHVSTDFVFDGRASLPYEESAPTNPLGVYGHSKRDGEVEVMKALPEAVVCRTSWLYGPLGKSFPGTMIGAWLAGKSLKVVADQVGTPTYTADLARVLADLVALGPEGGIYHTAGPDRTNWHAFATEAIESYKEVHGLPGEVVIAPIQTADWPTPTPRPAFSALGFRRCAALGIAPMRPLSEALHEYSVRLGPPSA